jgi:hypothetical protein
MAADVSFRNRGERLLSTACKGSGYLLTSDVHSQVQQQNLVEDTQHSRFVSSFADNSEHGCAAWACSLHSIGGVQGTIGS